MNATIVSDDTKVSIQDQSIIAIAVTTWQLQKKLRSAIGAIGESPEFYEKMDYSISRLFQQLSNLEVTVTSREGQIYNEGMNIEILLRKGDAQLSKEYIKETIEPEVLVKGKIVKKERVIIEYGK